VAIAIIWYFLFHPTLGLINNFFKSVGLQSLARNWLADPHAALFSTQLPFILYIGFTMLIFLAQIVTIPKEYYEAAAIDGASALQRDLYITIPLIRRALAVNILFNAAFCLKMIEYPLVMTSGGPGGATATLPLYMYYQMTRARAYGLAMAVGLVNLCLGVFIIAVVFRILLRSEER
jgi:multiple sugar transport system permease protein/raffinose/stachyose/melibiose transport system permease protein